jgi:hypothetical protein
MALLGAAAIGAASIAWWTPGPRAAAAESPKTAWGDPDLRGIWSQRSQTPLQRPARDAARPLLTPDDVKQREAERAQQGVSAAKRGDRIAARGILGGSDRTI